MTLIHYFCLELLRFTSRHWVVCLFYVQVIVITPFVCMIRWQNRLFNTGLRFAFLFVKCRGKKESPPTFILSNKERKKAQKNSFFETFLSTGGRL